MSLCNIYVPCSVPLHSFFFLQSLDLHIANTQTLNVVRSASQSLWAYGLLANLGNTWILTQ